MTQPTQPTTPTQLHYLNHRYLCQRDAAAVIEIDELSFVDPWSFDTLAKRIRRNRTIGLVAELNGLVVGFQLYDIYRNRFQIVRFAIHPDYRRNGFGTAMINKMKSKLHPEARSRLMIDVRESSLAAQKFLQACGFRAVSVLREFYGDTGEDGYQFVHRAARDVVGGVGVVDASKKS